MERLDRFAPPGMGFHSLRRWTAGCIIFSAAFSFIFIVHYASILRLLLEDMQSPVYSGRTMPRFADLIVFPMLMFRIAPAIPLLHIPANYMYFYQETKSIYTMKRLRSSWEMHLRCLTLPVAGILLTIAVGGAMYLLYLLYYYAMTPEILLPATV